MWIKGTRAMAGAQHRIVKARSSKRVNGCDTRCSSVRVTMYYELNNVMIGTAPVTRRISCVPCNGCLETRSRTRPPVESIFSSIRFHRLIATRPVINTVTTISRVSDRWSWKFSIVLGNRLHSEVIKLIESWLNYIYLNTYARRIQMGKDISRDSTMTKW